MKIIVCILLSWTTALLVQSCTYPKNVTSVVTLVEVYQITHSIYVIANGTDDVIGEVDSLRKTVQFPTGTICEYCAGHCYDDKINQGYTWEVSDGYIEANGTCNLKHLSDSRVIDFIYSVITLNEEPLVQFVVAENSTSIYTLELLSMKTICSKNVWRTENKNLFVAIGEENFIDTEDVGNLSLEAFGIILYNTERMDDMYTFMDLKCKNRTEYHIDQTSVDVQRQLDQYKYEIAQLRASVVDLQTVVRLMQKKLEGYESGTREKSSKLLDPLQTSDYGEEFESVERDFGASRVEAIEVLPQTFANTFDGLKNCPNFIIFPYENIFCILIAIIYVIFSVINTITNYFSLRMLRNKRQNCFVFYTLTQSLTTLYVCRCLNLTKQRIDKWLLDLE